MVGSGRKTRKMTNSEENRSRIEKKEKKAKTLWIQALKIGKEDKIESKRLDKI